MAANEFLYLDDGLTGQAIHPTQKATAQTFATYSDSVARIGKVVESARTSTDETIQAQTTDDLTQISELLTALNGAMNGDSGSINVLATLLGMAEETNIDTANGLFGRH